MVKLKKTGETATIVKLKSKELAQENKNSSKKLIPAITENGENAFIESEWCGAVCIKSSECVKPEKTFKVKTKYIENATKAILRILKEQANKKNELFDNDQPIYLQITTIKVPKCPARVIRLPLKNHLLTDASEVCLITGDLMEIGRKKYDRAAEHYKELLKSNGIKNVKTILPYHQLKTEYNQFELKKRLAGSHDLFLVEGKVCNYVNRFLGKIFLKRHKVATPVKLGSTCLKNNIDEALLKVPLFISSKGDTFTVQVGHTSMTLKDIVDNAHSVIESLDTLFPGGLENIRALALKGATTVSCPVYLTLKEKNSVNVPIINAKRAKLFEPVLGELSTRNAKHITVYPSGNIKIKETYESEKFQDEIGDGKLEKEDETFPKE